MTRAFRLLLILVLFAPAAVAQPADVDPTRAGPLDSGKMWLFENPPVDYLAETYDFRPDEAWFEHARLGALRLPGCSAAFVSGDGLVATNHHCVRGSVVQVSREGENLLDNGFFARSLEEERLVDGLYVDQAVRIVDVTAEVEAALEGVQGLAARTEARDQAMAQIEARLLAEQGGDGDYVVQVVSLYDGGLYSAYVFRRYGTMKLVAAPELQLGYFGGDADNFTFPRYALDFAFLRVYGDDGQPLDTSEHFFRWSTEGVEPGDLLFVIGNPGSTNRGDLVSKLVWRRDVEVEALLAFLNSRIDALRAYLAEHPDDDATRNRLFGLLNSQKAYGGRRAALRDTVILARKLDAEQQFRQAVQADPALRARYGDLFDRMDQLQQRRLALGGEFGAFATLANPAYSSATLRRGLLAAQLMGNPGNEELRQQLLEIPDQPADLDRRYLAAQLEAFQRFLPDLAEEVLQGQTPEAAATAWAGASSLASSERAATALEQDALAGDDPVVRLAQAILPRYFAFGQAYAEIGDEEEEIARQLGRARFDVYGVTVPPDATFSLRFSDGVVAGYPYNGTVAAPFTTFYGLYDHYYSYGPDSEWALPEAWLPPPPDLDYSTPVNFTSTADTIGGNSGSPAVSRDLELVGLNFDRTVEGLLRDYIYLPDRGRNVMVDARAVLEALDTVYDLDRVVVELRTGEVVATEAEADAMP